MIAPISEARAVPVRPSHSLIPLLSPTAEPERVASCLSFFPSLLTSDRHLSPLLLQNCCHHHYTPTRADCMFSSQSYVTQPVSSSGYNWSHPPQFKSRLSLGSLDPPWAFLWPLVLELTGGHSHSPICIHSAGDLVQVHAPTAVSSLRRVIYSYLISLLGCLIRHLRLQHIQSKLSFPPSTNKHTHRPNLLSPQSSKQDYSSCCGISLTLLLPPPAPTRPCPCPAL